MNGLIKSSLKHPRAVTVMALTIVVLGILSVRSIPSDILPVFKSPAVQTLTFYGGMPADGVANDITNRMERWAGQASGTKRLESRSVVGASIIRSYFQDNVDPNGALTQVNSLALAAIPNLPPGTLPPVVLPFDPTSTTPVSLVAVDSGDPANTRVDPLRRGPVRGPEHDHGDPRRERPGRLRRQDPGRDALSRPRPDAGAGAVAARRHEVDGRLQCLPADRRHQAGRRPISPSTATPCSGTSRTWEISPSPARRVTQPTSAKLPSPRIPASSRPTSFG